jgi:hypothetical protein
MDTFTHFNDKDTYNAFVEHTIDRLRDAKGTLIQVCDLHNELFNTDYFIIGYKNAENWLIKNTGIFDAIDLIKEYEHGNFGEVNTDFSSSEKVANMTAYILGEMLLNECGSVNENWDEDLTNEIVDKIIQELADLTC